MTPFQPATLPMPPVREYLAEMMREGLTRRQAKHLYRKMKADRVFLNDTYQVNIDDAPAHNFPFALTHLSIKRRDKQSIHDWRDLQQIKNALCGPEREAFEIYPAESRKVDSANQYHLWVCPEGVQIPCGWIERLVTDEPGMAGAVQRPGAEVAS